jgi:hypothetical protein
MLGSHERPLRRDVQDQQTTISLTPQQPEASIWLHEIDYGLLLFTELNAGV